MNTMHYKGYVARIDYDERDDVFVGRILGIRAIVSFEGDTVTSLKRAFHHAVNDYLADCEEQGVSPEKPASGKLLLRVTPEIHSHALIAAQSEGKSLNQWVTEALMHALKPDGNRV